MASLRLSAALAPAVLVMAGAASAQSVPSPSSERYVEVTPHVDFSRIEEVLVVRGPEKPSEELTTPELLLPDELKPTTSATGDPVSFIVTTASCNVLVSAGSVTGGGPVTSSTIRRTRPSKNDGGDDAGASSKSGR